MAITLQILGYPAALLMGMALGLTGGGGALLSIPILVYLFGIDMSLASVYSLLLVGLIAAWGAFKSFRSQEINLWSAMAFAAPGALGVLLARRLFLPMIPDSIFIFGKLLSKDSILLLIFSVFMFAAAASLLRKSSAPIANQGSSRMAPVLGFSIGILAGLLGAGGGFLIVPSLVYFLSFSISQAVTYSLFVIATQSLIGVLGDFTYFSQISWPLFGVVFVLSLVGMSLGSYLRNLIDPEKIKRFFSLFITIMAIFIVLKEWVGK